MSSRTPIFAALLLLLSLSEIAYSADQVRIYNWSDYIAAETLADFSKETGIETVYSEFDSNEKLESTLLIGHTSFDVVVPSSHFLGQQIKTGLFQELDKSQLSNWKNLDPQLLSRLEQFDSENRYSVPYLWGTTGIGYNVQKVRDALDNEDVDSWAVLFEPENLKKLAACGVAFMDSPDEIYPAVLNYMGLNPNSSRLTDYKAAQAKLTPLRPYIKEFNSTTYAADLANGKICIAVGFSGDIYQAIHRSNELGNDVEIRYAIPREGSNLWFDTLAIPQNAVNVKQAHAFINYLLRPEAIAKVTNEVGYANAVPAASALLSPQLRNDSAVYPSPDITSKLYVNLERKPVLASWMAREWGRFKLAK